MRNQSYQNPGNTHAQPQALLQDTKSGSGTSEHYVVAWLVQLCVVLEQQSTCPLLSVAVRLLKGCALLCSDICITHLSCLARSDWADVPLLQQSASFAF